MGGRLFSGSYDRTVRAWDVATLACLGALEGHREAVRALVPCAGGLLASGSDDWTVRLWDAATLRCCHVLTGHDDNVRVLAVTPTHVFSGSWDKTVRAWCLRTGRCAAVLAGHHEAVLALAVARGHLVSGSFDAAVRFWRTDGLTRAAPGAAAAVPCVAKCEAHEDAVRVLASRGDDADAVFSGSYDGGIGFLLCPAPRDDAAPAEHAEEAAGRLAGLSLAGAAGP